MLSIEHLSPEEQKHYILCACGHYMDMRDLGEVFFHQHANLPPAEWSHSVKQGDAFATSKTKKIIGLN